MGATFLGPLLPVGSVIHSMLTESQFQAQAGSGWVLADGRSVTGTSYATITGSGAVPDMRAKFLRGKDNALGMNPDGDLALGSYTADKTAAHVHQETASVAGVPAMPLYATGTGTGGVTAGWAQLAPSTQNAMNSAITPPTPQNTLANSGNETAPKAITVNIFIRIN